MYEKWIETVYAKFHEEGLIDERYEPVKTEEMSFAGIVNRQAYYLKDE